MTARKIYWWTAALFATLIASVPATMGVHYLLLLSDANLADLHGPSPAILITFAFVGAFVVGALVLAIVVLRSRPVPPKRAVVAGFLPIFLILLIAGAIALAAIVYD